MTALAGIWGFGAAVEPSPACARMLEAQRSYARQAASVDVLHGAALGCALYDILPEDAFDKQPYVHGSGRWMMVADARIDNRDELLDQLGMRAGAEISDSELLFRAYAEWGEALYDRLFGDFALAVWNSQDQSLTLVRDPSGQRPLHYHLGEGFVALASMPEGLHALPEIEQALDPRQMVLFLGDSPHRGSETFFRGVARVEPGHVVTVTRLGVARRRYWQMPTGELRFQKQSDYVDAFREQLERATKARLRGSGGVVAAHLSSGLDSSAVAASAAKIRPQERVIAFTSAPRLGFSGPVPKGRIADESGHASETAALYPNMEHVVLRSDGLSPLQVMEADAILYQQPIAQPCNYSWVSAVNAAASARGASVLLTGGAGNLTISAGGPSVLADIIRAGRWANWWREAKASAGVNGWRWRGVLASSFAPWLPAAVWNGLSRVASADPGAPKRELLIRPEWRAELESVAAGAARVGHGEEGSRRLRWRMLQMRDSGNYRKGALARWGIDERDPTLDRRLAEFCLSLPPEQLLSNGVNRQLARLALADRLPQSVLSSPRGYQYADWYETIDRSSLERQISRLEQRLGNESVLDIEGLRRLAGSWPEAGWDSLQLLGTYRIMLLRALAAGEFASRFRQ